MNNSYKGTTLLQNFLIWYVKSNVIVHIACYNIDINYIVETITACPSKMTTIDGTLLNIIYNMPRSIYELYDSNGKKLYENDKQFILLHNQPGKKNQIIVKLKRKLCFFCLGQSEIIIRPRSNRHMYKTWRRVLNDVGDEPRDDIFSAWFSVFSI